MSYLQARQTATVCAGITTDPVILIAYLLSTYVPPGRSFFQFITTLHAVRFISPYSREYPVDSVKCDMLPGMILLKTVLLHRELPETIVTS